MLDKRDYKFPEEHNQDFRVLSKGLSAFADNKTCIDLGCGNGLYTKELAKYARRTIAVDINLENLRLAKKMNLRNTYFVVCDISCLPFKDGYFDFAISVEVLTHLDFPDMRNAFLELHRVLGPGSKALVTMHNRIRFVFHSLKHLKFPSAKYNTAGLPVYPVGAAYFKENLCKNRFVIAGSLKYLNFSNGFSWDTYSRKKIKSFFIIALEGLLTRLPLLRSLAITFGATIVKK